MFLSSTVEAVVCSTIMERFDGPETDATLVRSAILGSVSCKIRCLSSIADMS